MQHALSAHTGNPFDQSGTNAGSNPRSSENTAKPMAELKVQYLLEKVCHNRLDRHERALVNSALAGLGLLDEDDRSLALGVLAEFQAQVR
jgi:hypothetical protein